MIQFRRHHVSIGFWLLVALVCAAGLILVARKAAGEDQGASYADQARQGRALAEKLCAGCHVIDASHSGSVPAGVPSFRGIANRPGQSAAQIRSVLLHPHPPMPDVQLSYPEIDRILVYVDSLRSDAAGPPLVPRRSEPGKPVYPDPT